MLLNVYPLNVNLEVDRIRVVIISDQGSQYSVISPNGLL